MKTVANLLSLRKRTLFISYTLINVVSLAYIFLPIFLFCLGWVKLYISIPACILVVIGLILSIRQKEDTEFQGAGLSFSIFGFFLICFIILFIVFFSGIGGYAFRDSDYVKHNAFLKDLIEKPWPVVYDHIGPEGETYMLSSYIGYYLPAAAVGKLFGWSLANHFAFGWACLGLFLTILWFLRLVGSNSVFFVLMFLFFGGLDIIGAALLDTWPVNATALGALDVSRHLEHLDTWVFRYPGLPHLCWILQSFISLLYVGPHHVLPGWMIVLMIMSNTIHNRSAKNILFLWSASIIGSPFVTLGLVPYLLLSLFLVRLKGILSFQNLIVAPILILITGSFIGLHQGQNVHGWLWEFNNVLEVWPVLFLFCAIEFGLYAAFCPALSSPAPYTPQRIWFWTSIICMFLSTLYRIGDYPTFTSKMTIPSTLVFAVCLASTIHLAKTDKEKTLVHILKILLVFGACGGLFRLSKGMARKPISFGIGSIDRYGSVVEWGDQQWNVVRDHVSNKKEGFFWRYLASADTKESK